MNLRTVAKINNIDIIVLDSGEKYVAIKPICELLGVAPHKQMEKLKAHYIYGPVTTLRGATGKDNKEYKMLTIPYKFVFGWILSINPKNVSEEARESVVNYQLICHDILLKSFMARAYFFEYKHTENEKIAEVITEQESIIKAAKKIINEKKNDIKAIKDKSFDEWSAEQRQMKMDF